MGRGDKIDNSPKPSDPLLQQKREMLGKIIDEKKKDDPTLGFFKNTVIDYLLDDGKNGLKLGKGLKGIMLKTFCKSLDELEEMSKKIIECNTGSELSSLQTSVLNGSNTTPEPSASGETIIAQDNDNCEHYAIDNFDIRVSKRIHEMYKQLKGVEKPNLAPFACAIKGYETIKRSLRNKKYLTIVDFTKPNDKNRFYVINMDTKTVEHATTVGHGDGSGTSKRAESFSNKNGSHQSSLGFYRTPSNYESPTNRKWTGLRMKGIETGCNSDAASRGIFMHPGGKISQGCFTLPSNLSKEIMDKVKGDSLLFAYAKSREYFTKSQNFSTNSNGEVLAA